MTRASPLVVCRRAGAVTSAGTVLGTPHTTAAALAQRHTALVPLGRHIRHVDQEPYCRSVQFSCKQAQRRPARTGRLQWEEDEGRPRTRLRDGVDGFLQVIIKEPTASEGEERPPAACKAGHAHNSGALLLDLYFLDSSRHSGDAAGDRRQGATCGDKGGSGKKLDQCLKIRSNPQAPGEGARGRGNAGERGPVMVRERTTVQARSQRPGASAKGMPPKLTAAVAAAEAGGRRSVELGRGEGVTGVAIGPRREGSEAGEVRLPTLGSRAGTYLGPVTTPALSAVSSSSSMKARAKRAEDVLWLSGMRPNYVGTDEGSPPRLPETPAPKKATPGTAKSEPAPASSPLVASPRAERIKSSAPLTSAASRPLYLYSDFGFNREALRENLGMTQRKRLPRDSAALEREVGTIAERHIVTIQTPSQYTRTSRARQCVEGLRQTLYPVQGQAVREGNARGQHPPRLTARGVTMFGSKGKLGDSRGELPGVSALPPIDGFNLPIYGQLRGATAASYM